MNIKRKTIPVEEISMDELREKENAEDETNLFEHKLGLYDEMNTDSIGIRTDLSRLFKKGFFSPTEKKAIIKKLGDYKLNAAERKAYQRALQKLTSYYLN